MGDKTGVGWTDHTFNAWWGCVKHSPACKFCYAESQANTVGRTGLWGPASTTKRTIMQESTWKNPYKWNRQAIKEDRFHKVFCGSMSDICEDIPQVRDARARLVQVIEETPMLRWQLLTKRPEHFTQLFPYSLWKNSVGAGCSVENQEWAEKRIPALLQVPAAYRFLSVEPLLGPVDITNYLWGIDWVIIGGESDFLLPEGEKHAREMELAWVHALLEQCHSVHIPVFVKQLGSVWARKQHAQDLKGERMSEWPKKLQVQKLPYHLTP